MFPANFTDSQLPTITFPVGESEVTLAPGDIVCVQVDENWIMGSIQSRGDSTADVFGVFWLRNVYAIFDLGNGTDFLRFGVVSRSFNST